MAFRNDHEAALARADALEIELSRARSEASASRADAGAAAARIAELEKQVAELRAKAPEPEPPATRTTPPESSPARPGFNWLWFGIEIVVVVALVAALVYYRRGHPRYRFETTTPSAAESERLMKQKHDEDCRLCQQLVSSGQATAASCGCP